MAASGRTASATSGASGAAPIQTRTAERKAVEEDIVHSRFGVLYLLANLDIELDTGQIALTAASQVVGAIGSGLSTDMNKLGSKDSSRPGFTIGKMDVTAQQATNASAVAIQHSKTVVKTVGAAPGALMNLLKTAPGGEVDTRTVGQQAATYLPCTMAALRATGRLIPDDYRPGRYKNYAVKTVGAVAVGAVMSTVAFAADVLYNIYQLVKKAVIAMKDMVLERIRLSKFGADLGTISKIVVKFVVDKVVTHAAPFVGPALDIGSGIVRTFEAARNKISSWMDRRRISIVPGHPEEIAKTIESTMEMGLFKGLWDVIAGVGKMAVAVLLPGLGSLVGAVVSGIEWLVKFLWRMAENYAIKKYLELVRGYYQLEKGRATGVSHAVQDVGLSAMGDASTVTSGMPRINVVPNRLEPNLGSGGVIANTQQFTELFKLGCEASPMIPMLTLNSGICGSLWTLIHMFDDAGDVIGTNKPKTAASTFDIGNNYFTRLKRFGSTYLENSGFKFVARDPNNKYMAGLMKHVLNHRGPTTVGGQVVRFLAA